MKTFKILQIITEILIVIGFASLSNSWIAGNVGTLLGFEQVGWQYNAIAMFLASTSLSLVLLVKERKHAKEKKPE